MKYSFYVTEIYKGGPKEGHLLTAGNTRVCNCTIPEGSEYYDFSEMPEDIQLCPNSTYRLQNDMSKLERWTGRESD